MPKKDKLDPKEIEREYGFAYEFFQSDPELMKLLKEAVANTWDVQRFEAAFKDTNWYRKHSDVWRQMTALKYSDPATYAERAFNMRTQITSLAGQFGIQLSKKELERYTERGLLFGWSPDQVVNHIAKEVAPNKKGQYRGDLSAIQDQLERTAHRNGIKLNDDQVQKWMQQIVKGDASVGQFENYIRGIAAKTFGAYSEQIQAGMDVADVAAPYMQSMADILELNPASVDLFDKTIRRALSSKDEKGNPVPMSITDFEDSLRADKRWQYTDAAKEMAQGYAVALGKLWGVLS